MFVYGVVWLAKVDLGGYVTDLTLARHKGAHGLLAQGEGIVEIRTITITGGPIVRVGDRLRADVVRRGWF